MPNRSSEGLTAEFCITNESLADLSEVHSFIAEHFPYSFESAAQTLRSTKTLSVNHSFVVRRAGHIVALIRAWRVGLTGLDVSCAILWLGPLIVHPSYRSLGLGKKLLLRVIKQAEADKISAIFLLGDCEYYSRFGFRSDLASKVEISGQVGKYVASRLQVLPLKGWGIQDKQEELYRLS